MLGGGIFTTQNKTLPGTYINFVGKDPGSNVFGERGNVGIALPLTTKGKIIEVEFEDFNNDCMSLLGVENTDDKALPLREIFKNSKKVVVYDLGNPLEDGETEVATIMKAFEGYELNAIVAYTKVAEDITQYVNSIKQMRDDGKKCQLVTYKAQTPNHEGVVNLTTACEGDKEYALTAWVGGVIAGCPVNKSCTNQLYDGELTVKLESSQSELEDKLRNGEFQFHKVYNNVRVLEDINSLTEFTEEKTKDFRHNQTIRVIDQIANDIAKMFNMYYIGKVRNDAPGRASLWGRIVKHHRELERIGAIEPFNSENLTVEKGDSKMAVVVQDAVTPVVAMEQIYMTVIVE